MQKGCYFHVFGIKTSIIMSSGYLPAQVLVGVCLLVSICSAVGPPKQVGAYQAKQVAKIGQSKKRFDCPVSADPPDLLMIQWVKDGETISEGLWPRFRISKEGSLRIRDVLFEDAGQYVCKATNGFGSINVNFSLIVIDAATGQFQTGRQEKPHNKNEEDPLKEGVPPYFIEEKKMQRKSIIVRPVQSSARLRCRADGNPRPVVQWIKDGHSSLDTKPPDDGDEDIHQSKWTLKLTNLQESDTGNYECVVSNKYGVINFTYSLEVIGKIKSKPLLIGPSPLNKTVIVGGTASFLCKVKSAVQPHIQWLKRVDKDSDIELNNSSIIEVKGQKLVVLKTAEVWEDSEGFFLNKIVIKNVLPLDVGMYICLAANSVGYSFRSAFLQLNGDNNLHSELSDSNRDEPSDSPISLPLMIAIPTIVIIVLVIVAIYCLQRRNRCNTQSNSHRNTRFNAVPTHEREVYTPPVHTNPHMVPQHMAPPGSRSSGEKMSKNHNIDFYSDISSVSRCHHQQQQQQQQQPPHPGVQYGY